MRSRITNENARIITRDELAVVVSTEEGIIIEASEEVEEMITSPMECVDVTMGNTVGLSVLTIQRMEGVGQDMEDNPQTIAKAIVEAMEVNNTTVVEDTDVITIKVTTINISQRMAIMAQATTHNHTITNLNQNLLLW